MENRRIRIEIPEHKSKERIDTFLAHEIAGVSRSQIQRAVKEGLITVNGQHVKVRHQVQPFEVIEIIITRSPPPDILPESIPLNIVFEDEHLIIVNKPAGMVVHPAYGHSGGTLVNALLAHCNTLSIINDPTRPGIVHRIDKDTSGLLVIAKQDEVHRHLAKQFSEKRVKREYRALVWGRIKKGAGTVETLLARSTKDRKKIAVSGTGKTAVTHYTVLERFSFISFLKLNLETGRTHQIRVHLAHLGNPVFGDQTYGGRSRQLGGLNYSKTQLAVSLLEMMPRQALHAKTLGFQHPVTKEKLFFDSDLPEDMTLVLQKLHESDKSEG
jgi:23S rRNA pseudouridine1911/1915/1917 synthase